MPAIHFENDRKSLDVLPGTNLRTAVLKSGIELYSPLHRVFHVNVDLGPVKFPCGADVIEVEGKGMNARSPEEETVISGRWFLKRKVTPNMRLACQVVVNGDVNKDAAWYYPEPKAAAKNIAGYIAFWKGVKIEK